MFKIGVNNCLTCFGSKIYCQQDKNKCPFVKLTNPYPKESKRIRRYYSNHTKLIVNPIHSVEESLKDIWEDFE